MIVQRRTYYGKAGLGDALIEHLNEGNLMARKYGLAIIPRVLPDRNTGRTDRVVVEWEAKEMNEFFSVGTEVVAYPEGEEEFETWFARLCELIEYADVDTWRVV